MVRRCCVVTCRNGRASAETDERVSYFRVPTERSLYERWAAVIGATGSHLRKTSAICERHFPQDEVRKVAVLRDSLGNVIFQRPLIKYSLVKDAVPSIFIQDVRDEDVKKIKKRKIATSDPENTNKKDNPKMGNETNHANYNNILLSFNGNPSNLVNFNVTTNNLQTVLSPTSNAKGQENVTHIYDATDYIVTSLPTVVSNGMNAMNNIEIDQEKSVNNANGTDATKSVISIYIKPSSEINGNNMTNMNTVQNTNANDASIPMDTSMVNEEQASQNIPNQLTNVSNGLDLNAPKEVTIIVPEEEIMILRESANLAQKNNNANQSTAPTSGTPHYPLPESQIQMNIRVFDLIFYNAHKIKLPNPMWGYHKNSVDKDIIIFSKAKWFKSDVLIPPIYEKQVVFHESDHIKIYINSKFSPLEVRRPKDMHEMELILQHVDETLVCPGGPSLGECETAQCAQKDHAVGCWRHKLCPIVLAEAETICKFCGTINQVLRYPKKKRLPFGRRPPPSPPSPPPIDEVES